MTEKNVITSDEITAPTETEESKSEEEAKATEHNDQKYIYIIRSSKDYWK